MTRELICLFNFRFGPHFRDGRTVWEATASNPSKIDLLEDDSNHKQSICEILHHQPTTRALPSLVSCDFAYLVDKYDLGLALRDTNEVNLKRFMSDAREGFYFKPEFEELVLVVYLLDAPNAFRSITLDLVLLYQPPFTKLGRLIQMEPSLPLETLGKYSRYLHTLAARRERERLRDLPHCKNYAELKWFSGCRFH